MFFVGQIFPTNSLRNIIGNLLNQTSPKINSVQILETPVPSTNLVVRLDVQQHHNLMMTLVRMTHFFRPLRLKTTQIIFT
jgi:hypothetical protein